MAQYVNGYNSQNGMMSRQPPAPPQPPPNWDQQNWRPYTPEPVPQTIPVNGRWVENANEIMPKEVPMDNQVYFFPQNDYKCIYAKVWSQDGRLMTFRFLPEKNETPVSTQQASDEAIRNTLTAFGSAIDQRLASFEERINAALAPLAGLQQSQDKKSKKE